jgi:hypothetical protein
LVYQRLHRNVPDADLLPEAASEVFVDFLVRLNDESSSMSEEDFSHARHQAFLLQLCDRVAARLGGSSPERFNAVEDIGQFPLKGVKKTGLFDAVLKDIGDKLRSLNE